MQYKYIGDGAGIVGLPHVVTDEEAAAAEVIDILHAALENGNYVAVETAAEKPRASKKKTESEVTNG